MHCYGTRKWETVSPQDKWLHLWKQHFQSIVRLFVRSFNRCHVGTHTIIIKRKINILRHHFLSLFNEMCNSLHPDRYRLQNYCHGDIQLISKSVGCACLCVHTVLYSQYVHYINTNFPNNNSAASVVVSFWSELFEISIELNAFFLILWSHTECIDLCELPHKSH